MRRLHSVVPSLFLITLIILSASGVTFAKVNVSLATWAVSGGTYDLLIAFAKAFNTSQNEIEVKVVSVAGYDDKIPVELAAGLGEDILHIHQAKGYLWRGGLVDLQPYLQRSAINPKEYVPGVFESSTFAGQMPWVAKGLQPQMIFYNTEKLAKAGLTSPSLLHQKGAWNWDAFLNYAKKLTLDVDGNGVVEQWGATGFLNRLDYITRQNGGALVSADGSTYTGDQPAFTQAAQWLSDLYFVYHVVPNATDGISPALNRFCNRSAAMGHYSPNGRANVRLCLQPGEWDVAPFFEKNPGQPYTNLAGNGLGINVNSKHKDEAWKFIEFVISQKGQMIRAQMRGDLPIHYKAIASPTYLEEQGTKYMEYVIQQLPGQFAIFPPKHIPDNGELNNLKTAAWNKVTKNGTPAALAFSEIAGSAQGVLNRLLGQVIIK